jgi:hypothetical protein
MGMATSTDNTETDLLLRADADAPMFTSLSAVKCYAEGDAATFIITDDMAPDFPISQAELEAIETYLADVLDSVLSSG